MLLGSSRVLLLVGWVLLDLHQLLLHLPLEWRLQEVEAEGMALLQAAVAGGCWAWQQLVSLL